MTWTSTWKDILNGGPGRWKVDDVGIKQKALSHILEYSRPQSSTTGTTIKEPQSLSIFCPLAGDDPFVHQAWLKGHDVTSIDLVPDAVQAMRKQFVPAETDDWELQTEGLTSIWKHTSGRATLYQGDMLADRPELVKKFDVIYDKDSFGAIEKDMRAEYCERLSEFTKDNAVVYIEVKFHDEDSPGRHSGPPFHVEKDDLMEKTSFGTNFKYIAGLGQVYEIEGPIQACQTAHILKRLPRV